MTSTVDLSAPPDAERHRPALGSGPLVVRRRLLDAAAADERLVLVRAPLGFGKSSLLRLWADVADDGSREVVQVVMGPAHSTPSDFWWVTTLALQGAAQLSRLPQGGRGGVQALAVARPRPVTLVVDRIDRVLDQALVRDLLRLLDTTPGLRLVLSAQDDFGLALGRRPAGAVDMLAAHAHVVRGSDLLMTVEEVAEVLVASGLRLTGRHAHEIYAASGGWPRLVRTLVEALRDGSGDVEDRVAGARVLRGHLQRDILAVLDAEETAVLHLLGIPTRLTAEAAGVVVAAAAHEVGPMLERMLDSGLIGARDADGERVYLWPDAMREALREQVAADPARLAALDRSLAGHYARAGDQRSAVVHARLAGDAALVLELLHAHWLPLCVYGSDALAELFGSTPTEWYAADPLVRRLRDLVLRVPGDDAGVAEPPPDLRRHPGDPDVRGVLDVTLVEVLRLRRARRFTEALRLAKQGAALAVAARAPQPDAVAPLFAPLMHVTAMLEELVGDLDRAVRTLRLGAERTAGSLLPGSARHICAHLAMDLALAGEYDDAELWHARAAASTSVRGWISSRAGIAAMVADLLIAVGRVDGERARGAQRALLLAGIDPLDELWPQVAYARAQYALVWGNPLAGVQQVLGERSSRPDWGPHWAMEPMLRAAEADLLLALGYLERATALIGDSSAPELVAARARAMLLAGDADDALVLVQERLTGWPASARARDEMLVLGAVAQLRVGATAATSVLAHALDAIPAPAAQAFATVPRRDLADLAARLPPLRVVLARLEQQGVDDVFPVSATPVRLTRREQVVLRHLAGGLTRDEIAERLTVSTHTVKSQTRSIYRKLGARSRTEAVLMARERRLLGPGETAFDDLHG